MSKLPAQSHLPSPMADINSTQATHPQCIPWWIYILIAAVVYIGLTYLVPALPAENRRITALLHAAPKLAPIITIAFLLLGAKALYQDPGKKAKPGELKEPKK
jgi:hypothetical protein